MYLIAIVIYGVVCSALAWLLAKFLAYPAKASWPRWVIAAVLAVVLFFLPVSDEIVGNYQFERLCETAKEAKIYGTIPVGEDLYTSDGRWRIGLQEGNPDSRFQDWRRAQKALEAYVRLDLGASPPQEVGAAISIHRYDKKLLDAKSGKVLAEWQAYGTLGGALSRNFQGPIIVRRSCGPDVQQIEKSVLKFTK